MTDTTPPPPAQHGPDFFRLVFNYLSGSSLIGRAIMLAIVTLGLKIPLSLVSGMIADRQSYQGEAIKNVTEAWGNAQTFAGPMIVLPYRRSSDNWPGKLTLLPEKLTVNGQLRPEQRRRGLFAVTVYSATLDVVAEFQTKAVRDMLTDGRRIEWPAAHLALGVSDPKSIDAATVDIDGQQIDWTPDTGTTMTSLRASLAAADLTGRDTVTVRFHISFGGSTSLSIVPLGRRTEVSIASPWPSPSFNGRLLPASQSVSSNGFRATWVASHLARRYS